MSKEKDAFIKVLEKLTSNVPAEKAEEAERVTNIAETYYANLCGGAVARHVTTTVSLYVREVLPELSLQQAIELTAVVHNIIQTVLTYLVEDGTIKEA